MKKRLARLMPVVVLVALLLALVGPAQANDTPAAEPLPANQAVNAWCVGDKLYVEITTTSDLTPAENEYRVGGDGPGLPTDDFITGWGTFVFVIDGPGPWSDLHFDWRRGTLDWAESGIYFVFPTYVDCQGGCDTLMYLPSTAVVGHFTDNAAVYWYPGQMTKGPIVIEVGKTYWVDGIDPSGLYRNVLFACQWLWVEVDKVGPNFDNVWNGAPLPNHVIDLGGGAGEGN